MRVALIVGFVALLSLCGWSTSADEPADVLGPYTAAGNLSADLFGAVDTRASTWGRADAAVWDQRFSPPPGYRVRILEITGDVMAWPTDYGITAAAVPGGRCYGILAGAHIPDDDGAVRGGSRHGTLMADDTPFYVQGAACGSVAINKDFHVNLRGVENNRLAVNNLLKWKAASWLNDTGYPIHMEITYSAVQFVFVKE